MDYQTLLLAVEFGFKCHEKGHNLEACLQCFRNLYPEPKPDDLPPIPPWRTFTEDEQDTMAIIKIEEIHECAKDLAHEELDTFDLVDCIDLIDDDSGDTCRMLQEIEKDSNWAEMARTHDEDNEYSRVLDFCKRLELITADELRITDLGKQYVASYGEF